MGSLLKFIRKHWENIYIVVWVLCMIILIQAIFDIRITDDKKKTKGEKVTAAVIESMKSSEKKVTKNICNGNNIAKACGKIGKSGRKACNTLECCAWAKSKTGNFCVEGNADGPELSQDHKGKNFESFYYLNKKYKID
jgi:hypothetical protein